MQRIQLYPQQLLSLGCALAVACGGPERGEGAEGALEQAEAAATTTGCGGVLLEYDALRPRHGDQIPTCGVWNVAPVYELGYSFARTTPGVSEVFRCRRAVSPADIFMSRDPACGGHVREASYGFAR